MIDNKRHGRADSSSGSDEFCQNSRILSCRGQPAVKRFAGRLRFHPMKPFLHLWRQLGEIHLEDSRFRSQLNSIRFNAPHCRVFIYFSGNSLEVLGKGERREQKRQDCSCGDPFVHARRILPSLLSTRQLKVIWSNELMSNRTQRSVGLFASINAASSSSASIMRRRNCFACASRCPSSLLDSLIARSALSTNIALSRGPDSGRASMLLLSCSYHMLFRMRFAQAATGARPDRRSNPLRHKSCSITLRRCSRFFTIFAIDMCFEYVASRVVNGNDHIV